MSNLLLITDVERLRKIFDLLTENKKIRLRTVTSLEKGGEEITVEKPDVVFVQTHLSGLSADILLMHLKKQLGRKRSRFVLLASPGQTNDAALKSYQGWLDTSAEDSQLLSDLQQLLATLLDKPKKSVEPVAPEPAAPSDITPPPPATGSDALTLLDRTPVPAAAPPHEAETWLQLPVAAPAVPEPSLEEQGITYTPRKRLSVYSEFTSSFDSAVNSTPEPETLEQATPPPVLAWNTESIEAAETEPTRSKKGTFLLWLAPVIIAVVVITYFQQQRPASKPEPTAAKAAPVAVVKPAAPAAAPAAPAAEQVKTPAAAAVVPPVTPAADQEHRLSDTAVLSALSEKREQKTAPPAPPASAARLTALPGFIPKNGLDKKYGAANPGWELYKENITEFRVLREGQAIKAIQVIGRGSRGVSEAFMKSALRQVTKNPVFSFYTSEKKEGYEIQRGRIADNIKVVYYRDETGGTLRAFLLTWQ